MYNEETNEIHKNLIPMNKQQYCTVLTLTQQLKTQTYLITGQPAKQVPS